MTNLYDIVHPTALAAGLWDGLITDRSSGDGQTIYNYTPAAMYTPGAFDNPAVRACRGLIINTVTQDVVARPWAKFFNHGQTEAGDLDLNAPVEVTDKVDGSLGILHLDPAGAPRVATRGSFTSDQARHATAVLRDRYAPTLDLSALAEVTALVEIVYPANRIVCDYGDTDDLILTGGVEINTGTYLSPRLTGALIGWTGPTVDVTDHNTLRGALAAPARPGAEGLCVRYMAVTPGRIVKIKQDDYVALHRIVTGLSERTVWQHMTDGRALADLLDGVPDELHDWITDVWAQLTAAVDRVANDAQSEHDRIIATLDPAYTRAEYAAHAKAAGDLTPYLFAILDGRDPAPAILRTLRPSADTRARTVTGATA